MGLYSKDLWLSMAWYAPLFVTSTMVLWLRALKLCSPALLSVGMNCNFMVRKCVVEREGGDLVVVAAATTTTTTDAPRCSCSLSLSLLLTKPH